MNVIVTGANGYLGRELVRELLERTAHTVIGISRHWDGEYTGKGRFKKITLDMHELPRKADILGIKRADAIIHLAAHVHVDPRSPAASSELLENNSFILLKLLDWAKAVGVKTFVLASSMTVFANQRKGHVLGENSSKQPVSFYGLSKLFAEEILRLYCRQAAITGMVLRFPGLFGGQRKKGLLYNLASRVREHKDIELDLTGLGNWEFLHVADAAAGAVGIFQEYPFKKNFEIFNVGYADQMRLRELILFLKEHYASKSKVTIIGGSDYYPCSLNVDGLKKLVRPFPLNRGEGLLRFLKEIAA